MQANQISVFFFNLRKVHVYISDNDFCKRRLYQESQMTFAMTSTSESNQAFAESALSNNDKNTNHTFTISAEHQCSFCY